MPMKYISVFSFFIHEKCFLRENATIMLELTPLELFISLIKIKFPCKFGGYDGIRAGAIQMLSDSNLTSF